MQVLYLKHPYHPQEIYQGPLVMALGFFDGVHLGHQSVISKAKSIARKQQIPLAVMTFDQHPKIIYTQTPPHTVKYLSSQARKIELIEALGVDILYIIEYNLEFGTQSPQEFVDKYLVGLNCQTVVAGFDYTYGPKELANMTTLHDHSQGRFEIVEVPEQVKNQHKIGSSTIKELIETGQVEQANSELGYVYETSGIVVHGDKRGGRTLGYPTANVKTANHELLPGLGIYVVELYFDGQWYQGMASIGYNITFDGIEDLRCEINIFDFDQEIYGRYVKVRWHKYLRGEIRFDSIDGLIKQLDQDKVHSLEYFSQS